MSIDDLRERLTRQLKHHEGEVRRRDRHIPYPDSVGILTIGYGRNLTENGVTDEEAEFMLQGDIDRCIFQCFSAIDFFRTLDPVRQSVIVDMCFNLGIRGLLKFKRTLQSVREGDFEKAADEMLESLWAKQVKGRAIRLSTMMRTGEWPQDIK